MRFTAAALLAASLAAPAAADALLDRVVAQARSMKPVPFERVGTVAAQAKGRTTTTATVERYDGRTWQILRHDDRAPTPAEARERSKALHAAPVPGYHRVADFLAAPAKRLPDADGDAVYHIARLPAGAVRAGAFDLSEYLSAEVTVRQGPRPFVDRIRIFLPAPTRFMMVAKLDRFEAVSNYGLDPQGTPVLLRQTSVFAGTNPMAGTGTATQTWTYRQL